MAEELLYALGTSNPPTQLHLFSEPIPPPVKSTPELYSITFPRGDGSEAGHGYPFTVWRFQVLTLAQRDALAAIWTVSSVLQKSRTGLYIVTRKPDDPANFATYQCVGIWPKGIEDRRRAGNLYYDVEFEFRRLVEQ